MKEDLSKLDLFGLLERLTPTPEPAPISLFPSTPAWLWVALFGLALLAWLSIRVLRHRRTNAYRRAALLEIAAVHTSPAAIAEILRRTALVAFPRRDVAGLHGEAWLEFLDRTGGEPHFREGPGRAFAQAPYQPVERRPGGEETVEAAQLASLAARWVRSHHREEDREEDSAA